MFSLNVRSRCTQTRLWTLATSTSPSFPRGPQGHRLGLLHLQESGWRWRVTMWRFWEGNSPRGADHPHPQDPFLLNCQKKQTFRFSMPSLSLSYRGSWLQIKNRMMTIWCCKRRWEDCQYWIHHQFYNILEQDLPPWNISLCLIADPICSYK